MIYTKIGFMKNTGSRHVDIEIDEYCDDTDDTDDTTIVGPCIRLSSEMAGGAKGHIQLSISDMESLVHLFKRYITMKDYIGIDHEPTEIIYYSM